MNKFSVALLAAAASMLVPGPARAQTVRMRPNPRASEIPSRSDGVIEGLTAASWSAPDGAVTEAKVNRVLQALRADPAGAKLADQAVLHAQATTGDAFWKVVSVCPTTLDPSILGQAQSGVSIRSLLIRDIEESALNPGGARADAFARDFYRARLAELRARSSIAATSPDLLELAPDVAKLRSFQTPPGICLRGDLTPVQAVSVLHHEMVHYNAMDWRKSVDIAGFGSKQDYELKTVLAPGDEVDAYISEWSHDIRLSGKFAVPRLVEPFFTPEGAYIPKDSSGRDNRDAIARLILDGPIFVGSGYALGRFLSEYPDSLVNERSFQDGITQLLGSLKENRQTNVPFYRQQADLKKTDADAFLREDEAAIPRLASEQLSSQARVSTLDALLAKFKDWDCAEVKKHVGC